ncbi:MAG TPA: DUF2179 domain-containing protein [Methylomusa anaerophila]|nr:DUF2179 domain-containing protein [Methylomusa anaerophila]HML89023.1 DUF2179 domain-containing protein [Methylomusa anaerophila]
MVKLKAIIDDKDPHAFVVTIHDVHDIIGGRVKTQKTIL